MPIMLDGYRQDAPEAITVAGLPERLSLAARRVTGELNERLVRRAGRIQRKLFAMASSPLEAVIGAKDS